MRFQFPSGTSAGQGEVRIEQPSPSARTVIIRRDKSVGIAAASPGQPSVQSLPDGGPRARAGTDPAAGDPRSSKLFPAGRLPDMRCALPRGLYNERQAIYL